MTGPRLRQAIEGIPGYKPGRVPAGGAAFKLSSNENPYPPLPAVLEVLASAAEQINRYPDLAATALVNALSERFGVPVGDIATGTGSVGVAQQLLQATTGPGDEVLFAWRSFEAYPILVQIVGGTSVRVPLTPEGRHDLPAMAAAVTERTRLIFLCSPNNPTGPAIRGAELDAFLDAVPTDILVVLDEAYREFVTDPEVPDGLDLYRARPNVAVLRTFSKAYGLAGLRVGYAIAPARVAAAARACAVPFGVSTLAQAAAVASLKAEDQLRARVADLVTERARVVGELRAHGWVLPETQGNFVWLPLGAGSMRFASECEVAGVMVRPFDLEGVRITVATAEIDDKFLAVAARPR
ncbi:histidinol-phosphate transaminase [Sporichthya sp.]|uniref:histidinol-phosphate transaminase n=1 Tax=Sporichthya sp. TaxID=65475 RepID=UPI0018354B65|nr:histidinol-phosphate transaminase [Sporichthya sp.]MBA3745162.1 histidinol-phosphate transaminase [Sporichthya sp.]